MEKIEWILLKAGKFLFHSIIYIISVYDRCKATKYVGNNEYVPVDNKFTSLFSPLEHNCTNHSLKHKLPKQKPTKLDTQDINEKNSLNDISKDTSLAGESVSGESLIS